MAEENKQSGTNMLAPVGTTTSLRSMLTQSQNSLAAVLPNHMKADRIIRLAILAAVKDPKVLECSKESVISSLMTAAQLGLEPNGTLGSAYLVPFNNRRKGRMELQLIPGYRGLVDLAKRSGEVAGVEARVVYKDDVFEIHFGTDPKIVHRPNPDVEPAIGNIRGFYAVATFEGGHKQFEWMTKQQVDAIRDRSKSKDDGPWKTDYEEMGKKTVTKRASKYWPLSPEKAEQFARAVEHDNRIESGEIGGLDVATDSESSVAAGVQAQTADKQEQLKERLSKKPSASAKVVDPTAVDSAEEQERFEQRLAEDDAK